MKEKDERKLNLFIKNNGLLYVDYGGQEVEVYVKKCFPWSDPGKWLSLRDKDDNEVVLIEDVSELEEENQAVLNQFLSFVNFVMKITEVIQVKEDVELRKYEVFTKQGFRKFQTKLDEWPEIMDDGSILIQDLAGDLFKVDNFSDLDEKSRKILSTYVS